MKIYQAVEHGASALIEKNNLSSLCIDQSAF